MDILRRTGGWHRREIFRLAAAGAIGFALPGGRLLSFRKTGAKPLRGIFPIAHTPFTDSDGLDTALLAKELEFIDRGRVHGFVWPQMASETLSLTEAERMAESRRWRRPANVCGPRSCWVFKGRTSRLCSVTHGRQSGSGRTP